MRESFRQRNEGAELGCRKTVRMQQGRRLIGQRWGQRGRQAGSLQGPERWSRRSCGGIYPSPSCTDGTLRRRKEKGPARAHTAGEATELDFSSPPATRGRESTLHLQQVLSAETGEKSGKRGQLYSWPPLCKQRGWVRLVEQGLPRAPPPPIAGLWPRSEALTLLPSCPPWPSLRAQWEDILPWGGVAPSFPLLWTPALHLVHLSGRPPGLPAGDLPH